MRHFDLSDVSVSYTSKTTGETINVTTTYVRIPDPHQRYDVTMGDEHLSFTAGEAFEALARLLGIGAGE